MSLLSKRIMLREKRSFKLRSVFIGCSSAILIYIIFSINILFGIDSTKHETNNSDKPIQSRFRDKNHPEIVTEKTLGIEKMIFVYTNKIREEYNLKSFKLDPMLSDIARFHSIDMVKRNYFSHINPEGKDPTDRAKAKGFKVKKFLNERTYIEEISENIGKMPTGLVLYRGYVEDTPEDVAKALMKSWMVRPGHRTNILMYFSTEIGVGVAYDGKYYVATQNFH